jgi:hypothetical protein
MEQYAQAPASTESNLFELQVDHELSGYIGDIARWGKFIGIVGFIWTGLIVLAMFTAGRLLSSFSGGSGIGSVLAASGGIIATVYLIIAALIFFPSLFVFNFSRKAQFALRNNDQESLNSSFASLKLRFKFIGILWIVILSIYVLVFLIGLLS